MTRLSLDADVLVQAANLSPAHAATALFSSSIGRSNVPSLGEELPEPVAALLR